MTKTTIIAQDAKKGRRAKGVKAPAAPEFEGTDDSPQPPATSANDDGPPKPSRVSGWGEDAPRRRRAPGTGMETFEDVAVNRVATFRELDNDLLKQAAFLTLDGEIDLKLLTKSLSTEADLLEEDKPWDWDRLFTEVTSELLTQWEKSEEPTDSVGQKVNEVVV
ncbi:IF43A-like protein [Mya arenaria]|uniref:IF43A-like protein n=1 Tax=Mya arenaria TaxID=6604 RepID=A0ABY7FDD9_MYAAR|nr:IF43A-like protein [Mya arenaria]